jgi:hypothetical protein
LKLSFSRNQRIASMVSTSLLMELDFMLEVRHFGLQGSYQLGAKTVQQPVRDYLRTQRSDVLDGVGSNPHPPRDVLSGLNNPSPALTVLASLKRARQFVEGVNVACRTVHLTEFFLHFDKSPHV